MLKKLLLVLLTLAGWRQAVAQTNVFAMPRLHPRHQQLVQVFKHHLQRGDYASMEAVCRAGTELLPDDPTWSYNLACALARQDRFDDALEALEQATNNGFNNARGMERDPDLAGLRETPRFDSLLQKATANQARPPEKRVKKPSLVGEQALISESNTIWNLDLGCFQSHFTFPEADPDAPSPVVTLPGSAAEAVRAWQEAGTAAGNRGDLYNNRDEGHSALALGHFPEMKAIEYDAAARREKAHYGLARWLIDGAVVLGNSSTAQTQGPFWRSNARQAYVDGRTVAVLAMQYLRNQMYVYPQHHDYRADIEGDVFPAATPYLVISHGSSRSDQPLLQALSLSLAAFRPETKDRLRRQGLLMPALQMLMRSSLKTVTQREDYLTRKAHPVVFDGQDLDLARMVTMAQEMQTNALPPLAVMRVTAEDSARAGIDYCDVAASEGLFDSPAAIARVVRGMSYRRSITIDAGASRAPGGRSLTFHWFVLQGESRKIAITPLKPDQSQVKIEVEYHGGSFPTTPPEGMRSSRVEIALCVDNGRYFSPPAFVTFYYLNNEVRTYAADERVLSVDYAAAADRYTDPRLSLPRRWRDLYLYDTQNRLTGWTRIRGDRIEAFTADGARVLTRDARNRPLTARVVRYVPRESGDQALPEAVPVDDLLVRTYAYASDEDMVGKVVSEKPIRPATDPH